MLLHCNYNVLNCIKQFTHWAEGVFGHSGQREKGSTEKPSTVHSYIVTIARNYNNTSKELLLAGNLLKV